MNGFWYIIILYILKKCKIKLHKFLIFFCNYLKKLVILNDNNQESIQILKFLIYVEGKTMVVSNVESISELTLDKMLSSSLTDTPCVYLNQEREVWVATEMCVQYLESSIDSIVIRNDELTPVGIVGGYDILSHIRNNPTRDFQYVQVNYLPKAIRRRK